MLARVMSYTLLFLLHWHFNDKNFPFVLQLPPAVLPVFCSMSNSRDSFFFLLPDAQLLNSCFVIVNVLRPTVGC